MANHLQGTSWEEIVEINRVLCGKSGAQHGRTSDGHGDAESFFRACREREKMGLAETVEALRILHTKAPFLFLNGNTFSVAGGRILEELGVFRRPEILSLVRHHITGTEIKTLGELKAAIPEPAKTGMGEPRELRDFRAAVSMRKNGASVGICLGRALGGKEKGMTSGEKALTWYDVEQVVSGRKDAGEFREELSGRMEAARMRGRGRGI